MWKTIFVLKFALLLSLNGATNYTFNGICPICKVLKKKSIVHGGVVMSTLMCTSSYYDEDGKYHYNDPNTHTYSYSCSNGHVFTIKKTQTSQHLYIDIESIKRSSKRGGK